MTHTDIVSKYNKICSFVLSKRLVQAFELLADLLGALQIGEWIDKKNSLETTYKYMLKYMADDIADPEQDKIYDNLRRNILELADAAADKLLERDSTNFVYSQKRVFKIDNMLDNETIAKEIESFEFNASMNGILQESQISSKTNIYKNHDKMLIYAFNRLWLKAQYTSKEKELCHMLLKSEFIEKEDKCVIISAITLGLNNLFDAEKIKILFSAYKFGDCYAKQRALIGLLFALSFYNDRLKIYPDILTLFIDLVKNQEDAENIKNSVIHLIRSKETENISKKIKEDFMGDMMKISPIIQDKLNIKDITDGSFNFERNPDWEDIFDKNGISDKIQKFTEMQTEGSDVFISSFSTMKNFPFFDDISNWFLPFKTSHSMVKDILSNKAVKSVFELMNQSPILCDSDKYSLVMSLQEMPESYQDMITSALKMEGDQLAELKGSCSKLFNNGDDPALITRKYVHDLYRFFKLHNKKNDFTDPFKCALDFYKLDLWEHSEKKNEILRLWAEFYFSKNFYNDALCIFEKLTKVFPEDAELHQKTAYCAQQCGDYALAAALYQQADIIKPDNLWNIKNTAFCLKKLRDTENALEFYLRADKLEKDNEKNLLNIGQCYLELAQYEKALDTFFKIEYLFPNNERVWRLLAWCLLFAGKTEESQSFYNRIKEKNYNDWINLGHIELLSGNKKNALKAYSTGYSMTDDKEKFFKILEHDILLLKTDKIKKEDMPLVFDKIRYAEN